ncbi:MAG: hypothetical protein JJU00_03925 [Opitutales bacterium]|nr:hypothetical protein [Opitutales bacterium]
MSAAAETRLALDGVERTDLQYNEGIIAKGIDTFKKVGEALARIRDGRLYRESHTTFEEYCRERWNMKRAHAYRMITAAEVASPIGDKITAESQARELAKIPEERRAEVVERATEASGGRLTAAAIREAWQGTAENKPTELPPLTEAGKKACELWPDRRDAIVWARWALGRSFAQIAEDTGLGVDEVTAVISPKPHRWGIGRVDDKSLAVWHEAVCREADVILHRWRVEGCARCEREIIREDLDPEVTARALARLQGAAQSVVAPQAGYLDDLLLSGEFCRGTYAACYYLAIEVARDAAGIQPMDKNHKPLFLFAAAHAYNLFGEAVAAGGGSK